MWDDRRISYLDRGGEQEGTANRQSESQGSDFVSGHRDCCQEGKQAMPCKLLEISSSLILMIALGGRWSRWKLHQEGGCVHQVVQGDRVLVTLGVNVSDFNGNRADCVLSVIPYYNKPTQVLDDAWFQLLGMTGQQDGLYGHFKAVADGGIPVMLYNIPGG